MISVEVRSANGRPSASTPVTVSGTACTIRVLRRFLNSSFVLAAPSVGISLVSSVKLGPPGSFCMSRYHLLTTVSLILYDFFAAVASCSLCDPFSVSQISLATQIGPTSRYTGPWKNAGLLPSIRCPRKSSTQPPNAISASPAESAPQKSAGFRCRAIPCSTLNGAHGHTETCSAPVQASGHLLHQFPTEPAAIGGDSTADLHCTLIRYSCLEGQSFCTY